MIYQATGQIDCPERVLLYSIVGTYPDDPTPRLFRTCRARACDRLLLPSRIPLFAGMLKVAEIGKREDWA